MTTTVDPERPALGEKMATKLIVILKTGETLAYSDADVEERSGSCRIRIKRDGVPIDNLNSADVQRWFIESLHTRDTAGTLSVDDVRVTEVST